MSADLVSHITTRATHAGVPMSAALAGDLARYLETLRHWNRRINLTSLLLDPASDAAIDRLIVEPLLAAHHVRETDRLALDVGSGGGSPALPLKMAVPSLRMVLVEARAKKAAFLREAVRALDLHDVQVETARVEPLWASAELRRSVDLVTLRAVRTDQALWEGVREVMHPRGQLIWFGGPEEVGSPSAAPEWLQRSATPSETAVFALFSMVDG